MFLKRSKAGQRLEIDDLERCAILYEVDDKASEWRPGGREIISHIDNERTSIPGKQTHTRKQQT